ncbi:MAG: T9SS type A sorting domain-containing protein, partial [bacterium]
MKNILIFQLLIFLSFSVSANIHFVNNSATGNNDGTSWAHAYTDLQSAISTASSGDTICVAAGIYHPDSVARNKSFLIPDGVVVLGGFTGSEMDIDSATIVNRDFTVNETILSGDLNEDDSAFTNIDDNSIHVIKFDEVSNSTLVDGFTISGGNANGSGNSGYAGAILYQLADARVKNVIIKNNRAQTYGGAVYASLSDPWFSNCLFYNNTCGDGGGAIYSSFGHLTIINSTISGNICFHNGSTSGGIFKHGSGTIINTIFWENVPGEITKTTGNVQYSHCLIKGSGSADWNTSIGTDNGSNIDQFPFFVNPDSNDFRLIHGSPAINAGDITYGQNIGYYQGDGVIKPALHIPAREIDLKGALLNVPSQEQYYELIALNDPGDITIRFPEGIEVTDSSGHYTESADSIIISTSTAIFKDTLYVRFTPAKDTIFKDTIKHHNALKNIILPVKGYVLHPSISISVDTMAFDSTKLDSWSNEMMYTITGDSLGSNVMVNAPEGFRISRVSGSFGPDSTMIELSPENYSISQNIYAVFVPRKDSLYRSMITHMTHGDSGYIHVSGKGYKMLSPVDDLLSCHNDLSVSTVLNIKDSQPDSVDFTTSSSNHHLIHDTSINVIGSGNQKEIILYPDDVSDSSIITIIAEDKQGYFDSVSFIFYNSNASVHTMVTNGVTCPDDSTGQIKAIAETGKSPYAFSLNNGAFQQDSVFDHLTAGEYTVVMQDAYGCMDTSNTMITIPSPVLIETTVVNEQSGDDGSILVSASNGTPPYVYALDSSSYSPDSLFTGLSNGTYNVWVKDSNGCEYSKEVHVAPPANIYKMDAFAGLTISPNPSNGLYKIQIPEHLLTSNGKNKLIIYNTDGKKVLIEFIRSSVLDIDISSQPDGLYLVKAWLNNRVISLRLLK